jgi:hypothetical protein
MITKDFDAMLAEQAGIRPTFKIGGQEFALRSKLPYVRWNKLLAVMRDDDVSPDFATREFFETVLIKADRERFLALLNKDDDDDGDDNVIGMDQMDELSDWIMEHFTGKARKSSGGSSPGVNGTGAAPNVVSLGSKKAANA